MVAPGVRNQVARRLQTWRAQPTWNLHLEFALRLQLPIASQDEALMEAARASGVGLVKT